MTGQGTIPLQNSELWYFWILLKEKYGLKLVAPKRESSLPITVDTCRGKMVAIP